MIFPPRSSLEDQLTPIDRHFADFLARLCPESDMMEKEALWSAAALVSHVTGKGHVCLDLSGQPVPPSEEGGEGAVEAGPEPARWAKMLRATPVVGAPSDFTPLVLDNAHRLYLYRYWLYEAELAGFLLRRTQRPVPGIDEKLLKNGIERLFSPPEKGESDWQRFAAFLAVTRSLTVISGGPGTGKTFTVAKVLALLLEQAKGERLEIALAAPTGKAAARLKEMIKDKKETLDCAPEVKALIPTEASTIHRLLGSMRGTRRFRFNAQNRLPHDVVIVDEASMVDLPLMAKLVTALNDGARLILLGDKDQLASVEPGAVFGDICASGGGNRFSKSVITRARRLALKEVPARDDADSAAVDSVVVLQRSYRFGPESGIRALAGAVNDGDGQAALELLKGRGYGDISWRQVPSPRELSMTLEERVGAVYSAYLRAETIEEAFSLFGQFHVLCALRHGPYGVEAVNALIEDAFVRSGIMGPRGWYRGQPIMVTSNDYHLKLFNGDVGILFPDPEADGALRVCFPSKEGIVRRLLPTRLPEWETSYAITVHKGQGSEFDDVLVLLPDRPSEVITRELIYTAITRAKRSVEIWGSEEALLEALARPIVRQSGLRDLLAAP